MDTFLPFSPNFILTGQTTNHYLVSPFFNHLFHLQHVNNAIKLIELIIVIAQWRAYLDIMNQNIYFAYFGSKPPANV